MQSKRYAHGVSAGRCAFTLVELLVVMTIIGLMTGLIVAGTIKFKDLARTSAADAQVSKYQRALETEYNLVVQKCHKEGPPPAVLTYCGDNMDRARAVHIAATLRINFPESFSEAAASFNIGGHPYSAKNTFASVSGAGSPPPRIPPVAAAEYERAVLLYLILREKATDGSGADTDANGEQRTEQFGAKSLTYFIDSFGYPLVYYRWADSNLSSELGNPPYVPQSTTNKDPLDPKGQVATWGNAATLNAAPANLGFNTRNRVPTIVSAGKDKMFDYFLPKGTQLPAPYAKDDLSGGDDRVGYRLSRFGSKGDGK